MSRIVVPLKIENARDMECAIITDALVDTGASHIVLPSAWKERLKLADIAVDRVNLANQEEADCEIAGPARVTIAGFRSIHTDIVFLPMGDNPEPLIGYTAFELAGIGIDMLRHRLFKATLEAKKTAG